MKLLLIAAVLSTSACATTSFVSPGDQMAANRAHTPTQIAADREDFGAKVVYLCGDPVLDDQATTGGESLTHGGPCWQPQYRVQEASMKRTTHAVKAERAVAALPAPAPAAIASEHAAAAVPCRAAHCPREPLVSLARQTTAMR